MEVSDTGCGMSPEVLAHIFVLFFFSSRRRHTRLTCDWSSDVCSSDLADVQRGVAEERIGRPGRAPHVGEHVEQRVDRRSPLLGIGRVGRDAFGPQGQPERALGAGGELVVGRLAVDQPAALAGARMRVRGPRPRAPHLLVHHEQQPDLAHPLGPEPLGRGDLGRDDALRVTRAPPVQKAALLPRRQMGRHRVEVRGQHDSRGAIGRRQDVGAARRGLEYFHRVAQLDEARRDEAGRLGLLAGRGRNVHEPLRQGDELAHDAARPMAASGPVAGCACSKHASCSRRTASCTRSSAITKVRLTRDAPWEISETLMSCTVLKMRAAIPGVVRNPSPTTHTIARCGSTLTSPSARSSLTMAGSARASSSVSETLTSDVVTTSTTVRWRSNTSNRARRKPYAPSMRVDAICSTVIPVLCAMALTAPGHTAGSAPTTVPGSSGASELQMRTGICRAVAGSIVLGCRTLAPKYASSAASAYERRGMGRAPGTTRGSAVRTPLTSVQIWISRAASAAPTSAAV